MVKLTCQGETFDIKPEFEALTTFFKDVEVYEGKKDSY